jgi:imidazolonepropionase-like amidohydrolase
VSQAGAVVNAEVMGWQDPVGSIDKGNMPVLLRSPVTLWQTSSNFGAVKFLMKGGKVIRDDMPQAACSESSPKR